MSWSHHAGSAPTSLATRPRACQVQSVMSGSPVAVRAGASLLHRWWLPRVLQHSALVAVSWRSNLRGAANTQPLRWQNFCSRWTSLMELSSGPAAQSRHHLANCSDDSWRDTFFGKHEHGALWLLICDALEKHLLAYLLTYLPDYSAWWPRQKAWTTLPKVVMLHLRARQELNPQTLGSKSRRPIRRPTTQPN